MGSKKVNISFIIDSLKIGGANLLTAQVLKHLNKDKFHCKLIVLSSKLENHEKLLNIIPENIEIVNIDLLKLNFFKRFLVLKKQLNDCDIIHTCMENSNFYGGITNIIYLRKKIISTIHGIDGVFIEDKYLIEALKKNVSWKYVFLVKYMQTYIFKTYSKLIAVSYETKKFLIDKRKIIGNKIKTIYHGIDVNEYECYNKEEKIGLRQNLGVKNDDIVVGYIGRITYAKGLEMLIEVINELKYKFSNLKFIFVGDGEITNYLLKKIEENDLSSICKLTGHVNDVYNYYNIIDIFVLPSLSEGIPLTVLEAMFLGKIVICSNVGGIPEIIDNEKEGFILSESNIKNIKEKIIYVIENIGNMKEISENAKKKIIDKFDLRKNITKIEDTFQSMINSK